MTFQNLEIIRPILDAISLEGYENPSPIQAEAMPIIFSGRDILASAQTGTGKTAAFAIPIIQALSLNQIAGEKRLIKALVLAPTRELAEQIKTSFRTYASQLNIKVGAVYGGVAQKGQESMLSKGIDILVATPGRLIDLMKQHIISLSAVKYFVLDEADTLLDMGFINDVKYVKGFIPRERQTMMFSATVSKGVVNLASTLLNNPVQLELAPPDLMLENINHSMFYATKSQKNGLLLDLLTNPELVSVLVFTRTKHGANDLVKFLMEYGLKVDAIHGNKTQAKRQIALDNFKARKTRVLVATDIAARGIDIDDLTHVINFDLPENGETYVHRIGRTGRKGLKGQAYSFVSKNEVGLLKAIQRHTGLDIKVLKLEPVSEDSKFKKVVDAPFQKEETAIEKKASNMRNKFDKYLDKKVDRTGKENKLSSTKTGEHILEGNKDQNVGKQEEIKSEARKTPFTNRRENNDRRFLDRPRPQTVKKDDGQMKNDTDQNSNTDSFRKRFNQRSNETGYQNRSPRNNSYKGSRTNDTAEGDKTFRKPLQRANDSSFQSRVAKPNIWRGAKTNDSVGGDKSFSKPYQRSSEAPYQSRSTKPNTWRKPRTNDGNGFDNTTQKPFQINASKGVESSGEKRIYKDRKPFNSYNNNSGAKPFRSNDRKPTNGERTFGRKPSNRPEKSFSRNNKKD